MDENKESVKEGIITWKAPSGIAASEESSREERINYYLATTSTTLKDGTHVVPSFETVNMILDCWDMFGLELAISSDSFIKTEV